jgi:hypothetical protein
VEFGVVGLGLAAGLGTLLALDPAVAAARNDRIRRLTEERRDRRRALESAAACALDERERQAQAFIVARVDAAGASAALAAAGLPADPGLTPPDAGGPVAEQWCRSAPELIRSAHERAGTATAAAAVRRLAALLSGTVSGPMVAAADLIGPAGPGPAPTPVPDITAVLARMLATLDARADPADRSAVDTIAQAAARRADRTGHLAELRLQIQEANDRIRARDDDAMVAAQLLDAIEPYRPEHGLDPERLAHARAALGEVVARRQALDDRLLDLVAQLRAQVEARASALAVTDAVADVLSDIGYQVGPDFSVGEAAEGMLEISHPAQPEHLVRMRVDAEGRRLVAMVYRARPGSTGDGADTAAEAAWCGDLDRAVARLAGDGWVLTPVLLTAPGSQPTPVAANTAADEREQTRQRYRTHRPTER